MYFLIYMIIIDFLSRILLKTLKTFRLLLGNFTVTNAIRMMVMVTLPKI